MIRDRPIVQGDPHPQAGCTLVELLVGLSLLSLITLTLFASLRFGILAWNRSTAHADRVEHITLVQGLVRRLIADAYPLLISDGPSRGRAAFDGEATSLRFLASSPTVIGGSGRSWFTLSLERRDQGSSLVVDSAPELAGRTQSSGKADRILVRKVDTLRFSYFGSRRLERAVAWHDQWKGEVGLPELVRVVVDFPAGDGRVWPELTIRPRITADASCIYDQLTKRCRGR